MFERILKRLFNYADITKMIGGVSSLYLRRYYLWGYRSKVNGQDDNDRKVSVFLHKIARSDEDRDPHDHPWHFCTLILRGRYVDEQWRVNDRGGREIFNLERCGAGSLHFRPATHLHRVQLQNDTTVWSLVITSPKFRTWGFWTPGGWVAWRTYLGIPNQETGV